VDFLGDPKTEGTALCNVRLFGEALEAVVNLVQVAGEQQTPDDCVHRLD